MSVKEESEKAVLKLNIHKTKITASSLFFFSNSVFSTFYNNKHIICGKNLDASCPYLLKNKI